MAPEDLIGRWDLVEWVQRYDDGRLVYPLGKAVEGFVRYERDGTLFLMICAQGGPKFTTGGQWTASDAEKARAFDSMLAYAGTYDVGEGEVRHHVRFSLYPDWAGGVQTRLCRTVDGRLELATGLLEAGTSEARRAVLTWRRGGDDIPAR